jgi:DNA-binding PucR family transcriptional regulator
MCFPAPPPERPENLDQMFRAAVRARLSRELVDDLLDGDRSGRLEALAGRALALGHDPRCSYRSLAMRWSGQALDDRLIDIVAAAARSVQVLCWSTRRDHSLVVLAQRSDTDTWMDTTVWEAMHLEIALAVAGGVGSIGVGGLAAALRDIPRSYRQAQQALRVQIASAHPHGVTNHDQLGLSGLVANPEAVDFVQEWLGPLLDYDAEHSTELTETLAVHLKRSGHYGETAVELGIHRSTVRYRIHAIRGLIQHDPGDPEIRFNLQIATRIWKGFHTATRD